MGLRNWKFFENDGLKTSKTGGVKIAAEKSLKLANLSVFLRFCDFLLVLAIFQPLENASKAREKLIIIETIETTNTLQGLIVHTKEEDEFFFGSSIFFLDKKSVSLVPDFAEERRLDRPRKRKRCSQSLLSHCSL